MRCQDCNGSLKASQVGASTIYECFRCAAKYIWTKLSEQDEAYHRAKAERQS